MDENGLTILKNLYLGTHKLLEDNDISIESMYYLQKAKDDIEFLYYVETNVILSEYDNLVNPIIKDLSGRGLLQYISMLSDVLKQSKNGLAALGIRDSGKIAEICFNIAKIGKLS